MRPNMNLATVHDQAADGRLSGKTVLTPPERQFPHGSNEWSEHVTSGASMFWTAGFRTAVISPYEQIQLTEPRGFADQTVRQVLHMAGIEDRLTTHLPGLPATTAVRS